MSNRNFGSVDRFLRLGVFGLSILSVTGLSIGISTQQAVAGRIAPISVPCWYYQGETLKFRQTCTYDSASWTGGYTLRLKWKDGVTTTVGHGLIGRGEKPCGDNYVIDGKICGTRYFRNPNTMKRFAKESDAMNWENRNGGRNPVQCIQAFRSKNSFCWIHPY